MAMLRLNSIILTEGRTEVEKGARQCSLPKRTRSITLAWILRRRCVLEATSTSRALRGGKGSIVLLSFDLTAWVDPAAASKAKRINLSTGDESTTIAPDAGGSGAPAPHCRRAYFGGLLHWYPRTE